MRRRPKREIDGRENLSDSGGPSKNASRPLSQKLVIDRNEVLNMNEKKLLEMVRNIQ